jgi:endonuclease III-like uncharacterized protein
MIDPTKITNHHSNDYELEEVLLWWVCAAGKNAITASRCLDNFLLQIHNNKKPYRPFKFISGLNQQSLPSLLKIHGIGCYNNKAKTFYQLANSNLNLKTCTTEDLEKIHGIGMKTSRCFIIHSRKNAECAGLDTHVLKFMSLIGINAPKSTPSKKEYLRIEKEFIKIVQKSKMPVADVDLLIWNYFSKNKKVDNQMFSFLESVGLEDKFYRKSQLV